MNTRELTVLEKIKKMGALEAQEYLYELSREASSDPQEPVLSNEESHHD